MSLRSDFDQAAYEHARFGDPFPDPEHNQWYALFDPVEQFARDVGRLMRQHERKAAA